MIELVLIVLEKFSNNSALLRSNKAKDTREELVVSAAWLIVHLYLTVC